MEYIESQFIVPKGTMNHEIFFRNISYKQQATSNKRQATSIKRQATSDKHPSLRLQAGGWAHRLQALESRTPNKVSLLVDRGS